MHIVQRLAEKKLTLVPDKEACDVCGTPLKNGGSLIPELGIVVGHDCAKKYANISDVLEANGLGIFRNSPEKIIRIVKDQAGKWQITEQCDEPRVLALKASNIGLRMTWEVKNKHTDYPYIEMKLHFEKGRARILHRVLKRGVA